MQLLFTHLGSFDCMYSGAPGVQWMDLMRRSCERLENNYSDLPVQCLNDLVSPCAGLGWAGLAGLGWAGVYRPVRQLAGRRTPVVVQ